MQGRNVSNVGHACSGCVSEDCGLCKFCKDNPRYGGPGRKKQCCLLRQCSQLQKGMQSSSNIPQNKK